MTLTNLIQIKNFALMQRGLKVTVGHMAELGKESKLSARSTAATMQLFNTCPQKFEPARGRFGHDTTTAQPPSNFDNSQRNTVAMIRDW